MGDSGNPAPAPLQAAEILRLAPERLSPGGDAARTSVVYARLLATILEVAKLRASIPPAGRHDPVGARAAWTPLKRHGSAFRSHHLRRDLDGRWVFKLRPEMKGVCAGFFVAGAVVISGAFLQASDRAWLPLALGLVLIAAGGMMTWFATSPIVFDISRGYFHKGRKSPDRVLDRSRLKNHVDLKKVHALQLISKRVKRTRQPYTSYELNLVLTDGSRLNVVDHGSLSGIRKDAMTLAEVLRKPMWDAV